MDVDEYLEVDSPLEQPVQADDDEIDEAILQNGGILNLDERLSRRSSDPRANIQMDKPIHYYAKPKDRKTLMHYPNSLPYECESLEEFDEMLNLVCERLIACIEARDLQMGFPYWNHRLQCLLALKYPIHLPTLARLARVYYHLSVLPGIHPMTAEIAANTCMTLLGGKKKITIAHLVLPWRPLYNMLKRELFAKERKTGLSNISETLLDLAMYAQRFFDPEEADEMLKEMLPNMDGSNINSIIATLSLLVHFLPTSHPQRWLSTLFRLWESFSSSLFDDQMLDLCARLAEQHVEDPRISSQKSLDEVGIFAEIKASSLKCATVNGHANGDSEKKKTSTMTSDQGLWNEVGIFTEHQFNFIMTKCLRSAGLPVGSSKDGNAALMAQSSTVRTGVDSIASAGVLNMKRPSEVSHSFATIIVYSMMRDSKSPSSTPDGASTPVENGHSTNNVPSKPSDEKRGTHLAGSKALSSLARFIQATESYFHPSNWGIWAIQLSALVKNLTWEFSKRWKEEEKAECKTPEAFRLTPEIKREFAATLRTVCLLSLFSKDPATIGSSQASLKRLAYLEPEQIIPPVLERAYSSLEALETTHRTMSVITALGTLGTPLVSRQIYKEGGKHLVPILHLCIPGIDLNDSMKTIATSIFIIVTTTTIKIDDLTRPELVSSKTSMSIEDGEDKDEEEDEALRLSTAGFEDWTVSFFRRVLALFEALPDEGKNGKAGGRIEEQVTKTVLAACDSICSAMSDHLFDINFKIVADYCLSTVTSQAVRVAGSLVSCFARHNPKKVLKRLVRPCADRIRAELEQGASSIRTTSTSQPLSSDVALHWHISVLIGALTFSGEAIFEYREELIELMILLCDKTKSERGYSFASMLVQRVLLLLVGIYPDEHRFLNPEEWNSEEMQANSHKYWGKLYTVKEVDIHWHVPSDAEIEFALEILDRIVQPRLKVLEKLQGDDQVRDKVWSNDFCRNLTVVQLAYVATNAMIQEEEKGGGAKIEEVRADGYDEFIGRCTDRFKSGFLITDPNDERYKRIKAFKIQFGEILHLSAQKAHDSGAEDQIDCVKLLVRSIRTHMISYAYNVEDHKAFEKSISFWQTMSTVYPRQKIFPRAFWVRRAALYHSSRGRVNSFYRMRTALDDQLINDIVDLTMSNYVAIRKTAQNALDAIVLYNSVGALVVHKLLKAVRESTNDDQVKGALYVLGSKSMTALPLRLPMYTEEYFMTLLEAQHRSKPSIQKLLRGIINDLQARFAEPCIRANQIKVVELNEALDLLRINNSAGEKKMSTHIFSAPQRQRELCDEVMEKVWISFVDRLLEYVQKPSTHWNFSIFGAKILRLLVRKDKPLRADVAAYFTRQLSSENPTIRRICQAALTKILFFSKLQTLCKTDEELVLGSCNIINHPLKRKEDMPVVTEAWKAQRLASFRSEKPLTPSTKLFDKDGQGWLVWSNKQTYYLAPPEKGAVFDWASKPALDAIRSELTVEHWDRMLKHFAQEKDRESLSGETTVLIKSIFQVFGLQQLGLVKDLLIALVAERDRHKHRAAAEVIAGMFRGAKHWCQEDARVIWTWLDALLPQILAECTPDSQTAWQESIEYILQQRDPRRAMSIVNLSVKKAHDTFSSNEESPWEQTKAHTLLRGVLLSLNMKMTAWSDELQTLYRNNFETEFNEVRGLVACNLTDLELLQVPPSFASVDELLDTMYKQSHVDKIHGSLFAPTKFVQDYSTRLTELAKQLSELKKERVPKSQGTSKYDLLALTTLAWIAETLGDHRRTAMGSCVTDFIPTIFECCNLQDNADLSKRARKVLIAAVSTMAHYDTGLVKKLIEKVLMVIRQSNESWRARLDALPVLQILFWQNIFNLNEEILHEITQTLLGLLTDPHLEVRNLASTTLSGIVRCSQREMIQDLRTRFTAQVLKHNRLPKRGSPGFQEKVTDLHAGILGSVALISAFPYSVPSWMPELICDTVARHQDSPSPVDSACRKMAAEFKRTHQDTWEEDKEAFNTEQLAEYYSWGGRTDYYA